MPRLHHVTERGVDHTLLLEDAEPAEGRGRNLNGVHATAAAGDVLDEELGRGELFGEDVCDGGLGSGHGGEFGVFLLLLRRGAGGGGGRGEAEEA